jgi:putative membrane protein
VKYAAALLALAGLVLAAALFAREGVGTIVALLVAAGPGLVLASIVHVVPMVVNARAWQRLMPPEQRASLPTATLATWARESVNALLPVARIGGEVVAYRIVRGGSGDPFAVAAGLVADMALSVVTQAWFAILGVAILALQGRPSAIALELLAAAALVTLLGLAFMRLQQIGIAGAVVTFLDRIFIGRLERVLPGSRRIDDALRAIYARRRDLLACIAWQCAGWLAGSAEIWLALHFLGHPRSALDAISIEALIQAVSSLAFVVPAAVGVQEGGFVLLGALFGLDGAAALALAAARRLRDLLVYFPGLLAWHWTETRARHGGAPAKAGGETSRF